MSGSQHEPGETADGHGPAEQPTAGGLRAIWESSLAWVRTDGKRAAITAAVAFGVAWVANVYIIAVRYEGTGIGKGGAATVAGNRVTGIIFWVVLSTIVLTIVTYAQRVGWSRVGAELKVLPTNLSSAFKAGDQKVQLAALLWGATVSLLIATLFSSSAAGMLGLGVLVLAASPLIGVLGRLVRRLGARVFALVAPDRAPLLDRGYATVSTVLGSAIGMAVAWQLGPWLSKVVVAVVAAIGAALLLKQGGPAATTATVVLGVLVAIEVHELLGATAAFADDGGWREGGGSLGSWLGSEGSGRVMTQSVWGGLSGSAGAVVGSATGSVLATSSSQLAVGGLSGEFSAVEAGATPTAPGVAVAAPTTDERETDDTAADTPAEGGAPADQVSWPEPEGGGGASDSATGAEDGPADAGEDELAIGGLSGEFSGDASDAGPGGGAAPGRADQAESDDEDRP